MDLHEIWQENKRWILGCVAGLLVYLIAHSIIGGIYDNRAVDSSIRSAQKAISDEQYRVAELGRARDNDRQIQAAFQELHKAMHLPVPEAFRVPAGEDHELFWARRKREVADMLLNLAAEANIDLNEAAFRWPSPVERADIERALVALCVLDQAVQRMIRAHHTVISRHPDAIGLRQIQELKIETKKSTHSGVPRGKDDKRAEDYILEYDVQFRLSADYRTVDRFLWSCRNSTLPLGLSDLEIRQAGQHSGEPLRVQGKLIGFVVLPLEEQ
jgi:hypothetical protein